jgi:tetratricopeptide (TPR) repeat protein
MKYLDFDLIIERAGDGYVARVFNSPAGQASASFGEPFSALEIENFLLRVGRSRHAVRRIESPEMAAAKVFGGKLFNEVFAGEVRGCLRSSLDEAGRQNAGLRVRLHLTSAPALADLPWEFLYNSGMNRFLGLSVETPVVRYLELPERIRPIAVKPPLRVLMMISSPSDYPKLDVERESGKMREALSELEQQGLVSVERQENATLPDLQRRLRQHEYHIFHFVGHGGFDEQAQDGLLVLEDQEARGRRVSAQFIGTLLHDHRPLRLAVLNACEGARASRTDPFAGTAQSLVQQGVPAVIAMQFEVTDDAAICFTREFYAAIASGYPVDAALAEARKAIFAEVSEIEWGTPVLYMRSPDGRVFDVEPVSEPDRKEMQIAALLGAARAAETGGDRQTAIDKLNQILAVEPRHPEASARLREISRQRELANLYTAARAAYDEGRWREAVDVLKRLLALDRGYRDAETLLGLADKALARAGEEDTRRRRAADLRRTASGHMAKEQWDEAVEQWQQLVAAEPDDPLARSQLSESRRQQELARSYARARALVDRRQWREALVELQQLQKNAPGYKDVASLVASAERALNRAPAEETVSSRGSTRAGVRQPSAPAIPTTPAVAPAPSPAPPQPAASARAKWFVIGGALGGVVALVVTLLVVAVIVVLLKKDEPAPPRQDDLRSGPVTPPGGQVDPPSPPPTNRSDTSARTSSAPPQPAIDPDAMVPPSPQLRAELSAVVLRAGDVTRLAWRQLNPNLMASVMSGPLLDREQKRMRPALTAGTPGIARVTGQQIESMLVSADGRRARVTVSERWSMDFVQLNLCVGHIHDHDVRQTLELQRRGQDWVIYESDYDYTPEVVMCHQPFVLP